MDYEREYEEAPVVSMTPLEINLSAKVASMAGEIDRLRREIQEIKYGRAIVEMKTIGDAVSESVNLITRLNKDNDRLRDVVFQQQQLIDSIENHALTHIAYADEQSSVVLQHIMKMARSARDPGGDDE